MTDSAVDIAGLSVRGGGRNILDIATLRIARDEMVGLLGPNGAGKSTLLRCMLGMQSHAFGQVRVLGQPVRQAGAAALAALRRRVGYVPQLLSVGGEMPLTVREVVAIGRTGIRGLLRPLGRGDWQIVDDWIGRLGLAGLSGQRFSQASGGEQRKALIARAMVQQPELLLLDEPTANLDLGWREEIVRIVAELHEAQAVAVVLVCHELEVLPACCRRVVLLDGGRVLADGPPSEVLTAPLVRSLYGRGLNVLSVSGRWAVVPA